MNLVNITDIAKHLESKLNKAIVNEIETSQSSYFNNDRETYRFRIYVDTGTYKGFDYLKRGAVSNAEGGFNLADISQYKTNKYVRYINAIMTVTESNIESVTSLNMTFGINLEILIPIDAGKDSTYYTEEMVASVRNIVDNAMALNEYTDFDGYNLGVAYGLGVTGTREQRGQIGDSINLYARFVYNLVESGINSTEIKLTIDDTISLNVTRQGFSRNANQEADTDLQEGDGISKVSNLSSLFTINFDLPSRKTPLGDMLNRFILTGQNVGHKVKIEIPTSTGTEIYTKIMCFSDATLNTELQLNASNTATLSEVMTSNEVVQLSPQAQAYLNPNLSGE
jgi:hypothetical protein